MCKWYYQMVPTHGILIAFRGILSALTIIALTALLPREVPVDRGGKIDWIGAGLGTSALIIFNFVWK